MHVHIHITSTAYYRNIPPRRKDVHKKVSRKQTVTFMQFEITPPGIPF